MLWLLPGLSLKSAGGQLARPNLANMSGQRALIGLGCVSLASLAQMAILVGWLGVLGPLGVTGLAGIALPPGRHVISTLPTRPA